MSFRIPYHGAGLAFIKVKNNSFEIFMGKRSRFPFFAAWSIPGGSVENALAEDELTAATREFYEETGIDPKPFMTEPLGKWEKKLPCFKWTSFFYLTDATFENSKPNEFFKLKWVSYRSLCKYYKRPFTKAEMKSVASMLERAVITSADKFSQN